MKELSWIFWMISEALYPTQTPRLIHFIPLSYHELNFYMQSLFHIKLLTFYPDVLHCLKVAEANLRESRFFSLPVFEKQRQLSCYPVSHWLDRRRVCIKAPSKVTAFRQSSNNVISNNVQQIQVSFRDFQANIQRLQCLFLRAEIKENIFIHWFTPFSRSFRHHFYHRS